MLEAAELVEEPSDDEPEDADPVELLESAEPDEDSLVPADAPVLARESLR